MALAADQNHRRALELKLTAYETLKSQASNVLEIGWLQSDAKQIQQKLNWMEETGR